MPNKTPEMQVVVPLYLLIALLRVEIFDQQ